MLRIITALAEQLLSSPLISNYDEVTRELEQQRSDTFAESRDLAQKHREQLDALESNIRELKIVIQNKDFEIQSLREQLMVAQAANLLDVLQMGSLPAQTPCSDKTEGMICISVFHLKLKLFEMLL